MHFEIVRDGEGKVVELVGPIHGLKPQHGSGKFCQVLNGEIVVTEIEALEVSNDFKISFKQMLGLGVTADGELVSGRKKG